MEDVPEVVVVEVDDSVVDVVLREVCEEAEVEAAPRSAAVVEAQAAMLPGVRQAQEAIPSWSNRNWTTNWMSTCPKQKHIWMQNLMHTWPKPMRVEFIHHFEATSFFFLTSPPNSLLSKTKDCIINMMMI